MIMPCSVASGSASQNRFISVRMGGIMSEVYLTVPLVFVVFVLVMCMHECNQDSPSGWDSASPSP